MFRITLALVCLFSSFAHARPIKERVHSASEIIVNRMTSLAPIPDWVRDHAKCVAALRVVKAGFIWGGQGSTGLVTCRTANNQWSAPSFFNVGGVNFGIQIGVQFLESVLLFTTDFAREVLNHATFQLGAELSVAGGPVGTGGGAGVLPNAPVLSYQRAKGLYAGATVDGFVLSHNARLNAKAYDDEVDPPTLLKTDGDKAPEVVRPFIETMNKYLPTH